MLMYLATERVEEIVDENDMAPGWNLQRTSEILQPTCDATELISDVTLLSLLVISWVEAELPVTLAVTSQKELQNSQMIWHLKRTSEISVLKATIFLRWARVGLKEICQDMLMAGKTIIIPVLKISFLVDNISDLIRLIADCRQRLRGIQSTKKLFADLHFCLYFTK